MLYLVRSIRLALLILAGCWAAASTLTAKVILNEIHYDPDVKTQPAEFIELYNSGPAPVDLSGWRITGGIDYLIPNGISLAVGSYLVIAQDPATILSKFGPAPLAHGLARLGNEGDLVQVGESLGWDRG